MEPDSIRVRDCIRYTKRTATYQSLQLAQWIIGDPSSGFLHMQYVFEFFLVTRDLVETPLVDTPLVLMFSFSSCTTDPPASCVVWSVRAVCRRRAAERVDMVVKDNAAWEEDHEDPVA